VTKLVHKVLFKLASNIDMTTLTCWVQHFDSQSNKSTKYLGLYLHYILKLKGTCPKLYQPRW